MMTVLGLVLLSALGTADVPPTVTERLGRIDDAMRTALERGACPGAVVLVLHDGRVVWRKAYGLRARQPAEVPMTVDTVFDLASLTKSVATATSVMMLLERGKLRLS